MPAQLDPYRPPGGYREPSRPTWELVWSVAVSGAMLGLMAVLVSSSGHLTWLLAWPLVPLVTVASARWRRRDRS
jgi:hypothetical protein